MSRFRFSNNASALLVATAASTDLTIQLEAGGGAKFPALASGDKFRATLVAVSGAREIVNGTAVVGDVVTVQRAQEGTAAQTFPSGSRFECRLTAGMAENFLQRSGDAMIGPLDMNGQEIKNARFTQPVQFVHINAQLIRPIDIDPATPYSPSELSSIVIPPAASNARPSYNGSAIVNTEMLRPLVFDAYIDINHVPSWFKLCDGTNDTPDLRGRYIKGWTGTFGVGGFGGYETTRADPSVPFGFSYGIIEDPSGGHTPSGAVGGTALTVGQLPPHHHTTPGVGGGGGTEGTGTLGSSGVTSSDTGGGQAHSHTLAMNAVNNHTHWVHVPPFYVLAKVMFNL